jgi:hypothetical protein
MPKRDLCPGRMRPGRSICIILKVNMIKAVVGELAKLDESGDHGVKLFDILEANIDAQSTTIAEEFGICPNDRRK